MASWRTRRKIRVIGILLILPVFLLGRAVYRELTKPPTCFDREQNGSEIGIDCGGDCARLCVSQVSELKTLWARAFYVADDVHNLVAYVENLNVNAGIENIIYEFQVYDTDNQLIGEPFRGQTFIEPGDRTAIFVPGFKTGGRTADRVVFRILSEPVWYKVDPFFGSTFLRIKERQTADLEDLPKLTAVVENTSLIDFYDLPVIAIVYDGNRNAMGVSQTVIPFLSDTDETTVFFSWPRAFEGEIGDIEILPRVNPFIPYN